MNRVKFLLFPLSLIYLIVTNIRNLFYDFKIFKSNSFDTPIIGIGNISVGGTGKTPFVEYLIKKYSKTFNMVLISRGYKRSSKGFQKATSKSSPNSIGDEPFQIFNKFKNIKVAVDKNRVNAVSKILAEYPKTDLVLLDDSFQHRKINSKLNILLTTYSNPFFNDFILPVGSLRESKTSFKRADIIVVTKSPERLDKVKLKTIQHKVNLQSHQKLFFTKISYNNNLKGDCINNFSSIKNQKVFLVTGIANSSSFINFFKKNKIDFDHFSFSDHHNYNQDEINQIESSGNNLIITTEKDYQKIQFLERKNKWSYLEIEIKFLENEDEFDTIFKKRIFM